MKMAESTVRKVLLAVDRSEFAEKAFEWYVNHIRVEGDYLILCHCPEVVSLGMAQTGSFAFSPGTWQDLYNDELVRIRALQHQYEDKMKKDKIRGKWMTVNFSGKPGEAIVRVAAEEKPKLIIIGTRGLSTVRRTMLGSVSDYVVHHSHCPVAVVRT